MKVVFLASSEAARHSGKPHKSRELFTETVIISAAAALLPLLSLLLLLLPLPHLLLQ